MASGRHFEIRYIFKGEHKLFVQPDTTMSDSDAWFYACLHARIGVQHNLSELRTELEALQQHAERGQLHSVKWEELP
ncbi:DUF6555 family protein [Pseudomonas sp. DWP3-1-2]|jgi:hypothetical protein|uniref:DUF6555 family protein n=1 Tax=Pseudomonas sp. DWP3-1-2 TaxID=2804645 RepID=UPI003CF727C7